MPAVNARVASDDLVGRDAELASLEAAFARGSAREAATVLVAGDAGMGKTRLVTGFAEHIARSGATVLRGGCVELGQEGLPYAPFVAIVRELVRTRGVGTVLELGGRGAAELGRLSPALGIEPAPSTGAASGQALLSMALIELIEGLARRAPVLVVLEDLHWADPATRELLPLMNETLGPSRATVVVTFRHDELPDGDPLRRLLAELARRRAATLLELRPLTREEQARQLAGILGVPPTRSLVDEVYRRAEGNPFFAEELVASRGQRAELPVTVRDLLVDRILALPRATRELLQVVGASGRPLDLDVVGAVTGRDAAGVEDAARPAFAHHILDAGGGPGHLAFRHALLSEVAASTLLPPEARRLHDRIADAFAAGHGTLDDADRAAAIAYHRHAAGDPVRAVPAALEAARQMSRMLAFPAALEQYERALAGLAAIDDETDVPSGIEVATVLEEAAAVAHLAAAPARAAALARAAIDRVGPDHDPVRAGLLHQRLGRYLWMSADGEAALAAYERALALVPASPPSEARARVLSGSGQMMMLAGEMETARDLCQQAMEMARTVGARSIEGHARNSLGVALSSLGRLDEGVAHLRAARQIAEDLFDDVDDIGRAIVNLFTVLYDSGRVREAVDVALEGIPIVGRLGLERRKGIWARCDAIDALIVLGRIGEAARLAEEALALEPEGVDLVRATWVNGAVARVAGDLEAAGEHLERARQLADRVVDEQIVAPLYAELVQLAVEQGDPERALSLADEAWARLTPREPAYIAPLTAAATAAAADLAVAQRNRGRDADAAVASAEQWHGRGADVVASRVAPPPPASAWVATAAAERDRAHGAADPSAWEAVAQRWDELEMPLRAARARWRQAEALLTAGGDRGAAEEALREAHRRCRELGAGTLAVAVEALAGRAGIELTAPDGTDRGGNGSSRGGLTPREREILSLLAEGRRNREIADTLFVSHRTVSTHVSNLLGKLGASNRSEAVAIARREGIVH